MFWSKLLIIIATVFCLWWLISFIRSHPQSLSKESLSKSFFTMGVLALILIGFTTCCVFLLKA